MLNIHGREYRITKQTKYPLKCTKILKYIEKVKLTKERIYIKIKMKTNSN